MAAYAKNIKEKEKSQNFIITGDLNIQPHQPVYKQVESLLAPLNVKDIHYEVNQSHEVTFGVLNSNKKPIETLLTRKSDYGKNEVLDYIYSDLKGVSCYVHHFTEDDTTRPWQ